jgi:hypothetical protein
VSDSVVVGCRAAGEFLITEALWDNPGRGRYRGQARDGERVLIAVTTPQLEPTDRTRLALAFEVAGVTPLRAVGRVEAAAPLDGLVEVEPAGMPLADLAPLAREDVIAVGIALAGVAARAHAAGLALGGLRPELSYAERTAGGLALTAVAPRAIHFFRTGGRLDAMNEPPFDRVFEPPDLTLSSRPPSPAADVFTLAGALGWLATGRTAFPGENWAMQAVAMTTMDGTWGEPDPLLRALEPALRRDAAGRPSAAQLCASLARLA